MRDGKTVREACVLATTILCDSRIDTPELDARLLLEALLNYSHAQMISSGDEVISDDVWQEYQKQIEQRAAGKPVHRILGKREFYGRDFHLNEATLIPRPDTEILVETVLAEFNGRNGPLRILEIGTGSGAIAVTLASEMDQSEIIATDFAPRALEQAKANALMHGVFERISFFESDLFQNVEGAFDAIVSNPPYIPTSDIRDLANEVREHDPLLALDGGDDGLDFYRQILFTGKKNLKPEGFVALEIGIGQSDAIFEIAAEARFENVTRKTDLSGVYRVVCAK